MMPSIQQRLFFLLFVKTLTSPILAQEGLRKPDDRAGRQIHFNFPILNRLFGHGHSDDDDQEDSDRSDATTTTERIGIVEDEEDEIIEDATDPPRQLSNQQALSLVQQQECCLFVFLDGSAHFFDDFLKARTGEYRLQPGRVNGKPHYVSRSCSQPSRYGATCNYLWSSNSRWVVG